MPTIFATVKTKETFPTHFFASISSVPWFASFRTHSRHMMALIVSNAMTAQFGTFFTITSRIAFFIAFVSYPPFLAPSNAFPCIAITYNPFAIGAARHVAILTVLSYNTSFAFWKRKASGTSIHTISIKRVALCFVQTISTWSIAVSSILFVFTFCIAVRPLKPSITSTSTVSRNMMTSFFSRTMSTNHATDGSKGIGFTFLIAFRTSIPWFTSV